MPWVSPPSPYPVAANSLLCSGCSQDLSIPSSNWRNNPRMISNLQLTQLGPATEHRLLCSWWAASPTVLALTLSSRTLLPMTSSTQRGLMAHCHLQPWLWPGHQPGDPAEWKCSVGVS